jgi:hypothetical protein
MRLSSVGFLARRKAVAALVLALVSAVMCVGAPAASAAARVVRVPVDSRLFLPCANDGVGEVVHFTGTILGVSSGTADGSGGFHSRSIEVEQGVHGVGETTGDRYVEHFVNLFFSSTGSGGFPLVSTQQLIYRVDSAGPGSDSLIRVRSHTTINASGETTVSFNDTTVECPAETP